MAGNIATTQKGGSSRRGDGRSRASTASDLARGLGWFSIGLGVVELLAPRSVTRPLGLDGHEGLVRLYGLREIGTGIGILASQDPAPWVWGRVGGDALDLATVAAGLGGRRTGNVVLALAALAGVTALDVMCAEQLSRGGPSAGRVGGDGGRGAPADEPEVERSITIGKPAEELYQRWRDPRTLSRIMAGIATVRASGDGRMHWMVEGPLGRAYEWNSETVDDRPGDGIGWRSLPGAALSNEGSVRFRPAPADRGTVATLRVRFDPPGGALGDAAVGLLGTTPLNLAVDGVLRRFKSLVETGEIPTTERQPAARADTR